MMTYRIGDVVLYNTGHEGADRGRYIGVIVADEKHTGPETNLCWVWFARKGTALDRLHLDRVMNLEKIGHITDVGGSLEELRKTTNPMLKEQLHYWA